MEIMFVQLVVTARESVLVARSLMWPAKAFPGQRRGHLLPARVPHPPRGLSGSRERRRSRNWGKEQRHPGRRPWEIGGGIFPGHGFQCLVFFVWLWAQERRLKGRLSWWEGREDQRPTRARRGQQTQAAGVTTKMGPACRRSKAAKTASRQRSCGRAGVPQASTREERHAWFRSPCPGREGGSRPPWAPRLCRTQM